MTYYPEEYRFKDDRGGIASGKLGSFAISLEEKPMKRLSTFLLLGAMTATGTAAATGSFSLNEFKPGVMPVLVAVDAHGNVTRVSPSTHLAPRYQRLLRENIQELVTGPATKRNKAVSSQFVLNMTMKASPRSDGSYDAHFAYVSVKPVPSGPMHWVNVDGHRLALAHDSDRFLPKDHAGFYGPYRPSYPSHYQRPAPMNTPSNRSERSASASARGTQQGR